MLAYTCYLNEDVPSIQMTAYRHYSVGNGLGAGQVFLSVTRMLADIGAMASDLFGETNRTDILLALGGTESLFETVRTTKKLQRSKRESANGALNIAAPYSANAALNKAGESLNVQIIRAPLGVEYLADVDAVAAAQNDDRIMLFSSAPSFVYGAFATIAVLRRAAHERDLWLHVDACCGDFISPFAKQLGCRIPDWHVSVSGVSTIADPLSIHQNCSHTFLIAPPNVGAARATQLAESGPTIELPASLQTGCKLFCRIPALLNRAKTMSAAALGASRLTSLISVKRLANRKRRSGRLDVLGSYVNARLRSNIRSSAHLLHVRSSYAA